MRPSTTLSNVKTIEGDEKKNLLHVPRSHLFMPLVKLKKNLQGLDEYNEGCNEQGVSSNGSQQVEIPANRQGCDRGSKMVYQKQLA